MQEASITEMTMDWHTPEGAAPESWCPTVGLDTPEEITLVIAEDQCIQPWAGAPLQQAEFAVHAAEDGLNTPSAARRGPPDEVVLEHVIAGVDVRYAIAQLRREPRTAHVPILLIAPRVTEATTRACRKFGVRLFVTGSRDADARLHLRLPPAPSAARVAEPRPQSCGRRI